MIDGIKFWLSEYIADLFVLLIALVIAGIVFLLPFAIEKIKSAISKFRRKDDD